MKLRFFVPTSGPALCAETDPDLFFPEKGGSPVPAKILCMGCEARVECLTYALAHDEPNGIWGGMTSRERSRLVRERSAA